MRAAVLHGKEDVRIEQVPLQALRPGEVRLEIRAALTCGTDLKVYRRGYHAKMIVPPAVFGHEMAGRISEVHPETEGWTLGERVVVANSAPCGACADCNRDQENLCEDLQFLNGAYAESIIVPERLVRRNLLRIRPGTEFCDAALTEPLACVVQGLKDLQPRPGDRLLILGSGPIGLMFAALAKQIGCEVALAGRGENRLQLARKLGARVIPVDGEQIVASIKAQGAPYDLVVEAIGKPETWEASVQLVRKGGAVNFFGGCPAGTSVKLDTGLIHYSNLRLLASFHHTPGAIRQALAFIEAGVIRAADFVDGSCSLTELPELFQGMTRGNKAIKTLVDVSR